MTSELIWLHADCLSATNPAFRRYPEAAAIFVFDEEEIEAEAWTLKRIQFLYECLLEIPADLARGNVAELIVERAKSSAAAKVVTVDSVNPSFALQKAAIEKHVPVEVLPADSFVDLRGPVDLRRFSRYWKKAEPMLRDK